MKRLCVVLIILFISTIAAYAQKPARPIYQPQVGDIILFQTPHADKRIITHLITGAPITHSAIIIMGTDGELKLLSAIGEKNKKSRNEDGAPGVIIEPLEKALIEEPDRLFVRTVKGRGLTKKESQQLTAFAYREVGKPFKERPLKIITTPKIRFGNPSRLTYKDYFCSKLVSTACIAAGILGPDALGRYINPPGIVPADLASNKKINLSKRWNNAVPLNIIE